MAWEVPHLNLNSGQRIGTHWADGILSARNDKRDRMRADEVLLGRKQAIEAARTPEGGVDWRKAVLGLYEAGDLQGAQSAANMAQNESQDAWRRERAAVEDRQWAASHALARERASTRDGAPSGFRYTQDGNLEAIPGGPNDPEYLRSKPDRTNAPPGYVWVDPTDPSKGLAAIPGGPAEKITPETAARLGLAESFLKDLNDEVGPDGKVTRPGIRSLVKKGEGTGLIDARMGQHGLGSQGRLYARIKAGSEALLRNLTGAGMNMTEASEYAKRYEPTTFDTVETLEDKLNQLERELSSVGSVVQRGRSTNPQQPPAAGPRRTGTGVSYTVEP